MDATTNDTAVTSTPPIIVAQNSHLIITRIARFFMRVLDDIRDILEDELKDIMKSGEMTPKYLEIVDKAVDVIKDIKTIPSMENASWDD